VKYAADGAAARIGEARASMNDLPLVLHARVLSGSWGGPDKTVLSSPRFLEGRYRCLCAYLRHPRDPEFSSLAEFAASQGADLVALDDFGPLDLGVLRRVSDLCRERGPRIWHGHDYKTNVLGALVRRRFDVRLVTTAHGWVTRSWKTPLYYALDRWSLRAYEVVLCVSEDLRRACLDSGVAPDRCLLVPNAIDTELFRRRRSVAEAKAARGFPAERTLLLAMGRLSPEKGFDLLIDAVAQLLREGMDVELWIAGQGPREEALRSRAERLAAAGRIRLVGFRRDVRELLEAADVFVLSSLREGLPNVVLEAMALEVPVVCTSVAGVPALVEHRSTGWLVEPGSASELAAGIRALAEAPELRAALALEGRRRIERNHGFAARMRRVMEIYDRLLETPRPR
jgi:glycosyltransferase involved in cell wall biosynthesis